jgi:hypothetical protein
MATTYLPHVTAADHEALRPLVDNYPANSYEKWLFLQAKEIANWQRNGWEVVLIDVSADDFVRYCRETRASPNFHTFRGIASAKAIGKFSRSPRNEPGPERIFVHPFNRSVRLPPESAREGGCSRATASRQ